MKKIHIAVFLIVLLILSIIVFTLVHPNNANDTQEQQNQQTETIKQNSTPSMQNSQTAYEKIVLENDLCSQITKEFVTEITGITIARVGTINDASITACDYYLTNENNSPYIAVIVNKNLNFDKHKEIAIKNKLVIKTDPSILGNHYIAWADNETRISNINLYLADDSFLRIDKNVERAIDNEGLIKLASALSGRLH